MDLKKIITVLFLIISLTYLSAEIVEYYFSFKIPDSSNIQDLNKLISIDKIEEDLIYAYANQYQLELFNATGISYDLLPHPSTLIVPEMTDTIMRQREWDTYPTYELYIEMMYQFQTDYPELCKIVKAGQSVEGRDILFAIISDNVNENEAEPEFMYTSTMHGDETTGYILMLRLIDHLLVNYGIDDRLTSIVDNVEIWINPLANPDGTYWTGNHTVYGAHRSNANGVDLNRNFPDPEDGEHPDGNTWQPETLAMMDISTAKNFILSANFHGGTEVLNYPWDTWPTRHADDAWLQVVSHTYADNCQENSPNGYMNGYDDGITNGYDWYTTSGSRQDFMTYFRNCREITMEISDVKLLPADELPDYWEYNRESFLLYIEETSYGFRGNVTNQEGNPIYAQIEVLDHDIDNSQIMSDKILGNYHRMIEAGTWDIEASAYAYQNIVINGIQTEYNEINWLDIEMLPAIDAINLTGSVRDIESGEVIPDAVIQVQNAPVAPVTSNGNGEYSLFLLEDDFEFIVNAPGYLEGQFNFTVNQLNDQYDFLLSVGPVISLNTYSIIKELPADTTDTETLIITNSGGGTLFYNVWTEDGNRNLTDSYVTCSTENFNPGESAEWTFTLYNDSPDGEWIKGIYLEFPPNVIVNGAGNFTGGSGGDLIYDGTTGSGVEIYWNGETNLGYGVLHEGETAQATMEVEITPEFTGEVGILYHIEGDGYGEEPHDLINVITLTYPLRWIHIETLSGSLNSGESEEITVHFDTHGLQPDLYTCNIVVDQIDNGFVNIPVQLTVTSTSVNEIQLPQKPELLGNHPNPFNPETVISFSLTTESNEGTELFIYNIKGQIIKDFTSL